MIKVALPFSDGDEKYINYGPALEKAGMEPVTVHSEEELTLLDALLLPGGVDINPSRYGQKNTASLGVNDALDALQFAALDMYVWAGKPVLGICRGHQLINVFFGGTLFQDLATADAHRRQPEGEQFHPVTMAGGSVLHELYGESFVVNSTHHQGVDIPGKGLAIIAHAEEGVVEGLAHTELPVLSVQWHPERMPENGGSRIFDFFRELAEGKRTW